MRSSRRPVSANTSGAPRGVRGPNSRSLTAPHRNADHDTLRIAVWPETRADQRVNGPWSRTARRRASQSSVVPTPSTRRAPGQSSTACHATLAGVPGQRGNRCTCRWSTWCPMVVEYTRLAPIPSDASHRARIAIPTDAASARSRSANPRACLRGTTSRWPARRRRARPTGAGATRRRGRRRRRRRRQRRRCRRPLHRPGNRETTRWS